MTVQLLQSDDAQAILLFGDLAYADDYNGYSVGQRNGYQPRWDTWGQMMQPIISHLPFLSLMGRLPFTLAFLPFTLAFLPFTLAFLPFAVCLLFCPLFLLLNFSFLDVEFYLPM